MNMNINYFDNKINFNGEHINVVEIENKKCFYRFVKDLYTINLAGSVNDITFFEKDKEKNMNGKLKVFTDFFNFEFDSKKYTSDIIKYVNENIDEKEKIALLSLYNKIVKTYIKILNNTDLPLNVENDATIENITKFVKISIDDTCELLDSLLLLINLESTLLTNNILFFINLKQYLAKTELLELYKYALYNKIEIVLIDSQSYGTTLKYEKKYIIDENLDEFVLQ